MRSYWYLKVRYFNILIIYILILNTIKMNKFITIAGVLLLGAATASKMVITESQLVNALENEVAAAERDVQLIKEHLQAVKSRRSRSVDPTVEAFNWEKAHHATGIISDLTQAGAAVWGATHQPQPQVEGWLGALGEVTGIASDAVNMGTTLYNTIEQPRV